jgi:hypothetical protein
VAVNHSSMDASVGPGMQVRRATFLAVFSSRRKPVGGTLRPLPESSKQAFRSIADGSPHRKLSGNHVAQRIAGVRADRIGLVDVIKRVSSLVNRTLLSKLILFEKP